MDNWDQNYKYCIKCGGDFERKKFNMFLCTKCGHQHYINPATCTGIIIENEFGQVMLVKRAFEPRKDTWDLAAGFINVNENVESSIIRELKEELGIDFSKIKSTYLGSYVGKYLYSGIEYSTLGLVYIYKTTTLFLKNAKPMDDISEIKYFNRNNIPWNDLCFPAVKEALKNWMEKY